MNIADVCIWCDMVWFLQPGCTETLDTCCIPETPRECSAGSDRTSELRRLLFSRSQTSVCLQWFDAHVRLSLRDKPSVMYFDILKCATATNIMAAALQGLQCPTTQVPHLCTNAHNANKIFTPKQHKYRAIFGALSDPLVWTLHYRRVFSLSICKRPLLWLGKMIFAYEMSIIHVKLFKCDLRL